MREIYLNLQLTAPSTQQGIKLNFSFGHMNCNLVINRRRMYGSSKTLLPVKYKNIFSSRHNLKKGKVSSMLLERRKMGAPVFRKPSKKKQGFSRKTEIVADSTSDFSLT